MFTNEEKERYSRHLRLSEIGELGQSLLRQARVLVAGAGGLGSPVLQYLAAAGVGTLGVVDGDKVDVSNLQRQIIHTTEAIGQSKTASASRFIRALNPHVQVQEYPFFLTPENVESVIASYDIVVDCTDNFAARFLVNDACVQMGKPFVHGSISQFQGQLFTHLPGTACYRCIFPEEPQQSQEPVAGPLGVLPGVIGALQATEVIKYVTRAGRLLTNGLLLFDALGMSFSHLQVQPSASCAACSSGE
ncbi:MAG: HesA/MoeB/ThiF family protein [Prevotella sp.]